MIGKKSVAAIETGDITKIIEPLWVSKAETATRVRGRIEVILDYAKTRGWRSGENPARWKGHLEFALPARAKVAKVEHHAALPWAEVGAFMTKLSAETGVSARALAFAILTAGRTGEILGARWSEIDLTAKIWTVPADRMKVGVLHQVPLSDAALTVLQAVQPLKGTDDGFVFPGAREGKSLSNMALLMTLRRMGHGDLTAHGLRSTFRDWAAEVTSHPRELAEAALAHVVGNKTEAAYQRGDFFQKRVRLMADWGAYCSQPVKPDGAKVVALFERDAASA